jgi:hypothetical protein
VGERNLAGLGAQPAADQRCHARRMMRRAERAPVGERATVELAGDRGDHRDFEQLGRRQRRQDRGQPRREHRLAGAGRADHQQIVAAGGCHLERPLGALLSLDVEEIGHRIVGLAHLGLRARQHLAALEMIGERDQRVCCDDLHLRARPRGFRPAGRRADQALAAAIGADRRRQHARDRRDRAIEAELAQHCVAAERVGWDRADRRHQSERDRQVVVAAFLRQVGGGEVDGDPPRRQREPGGDQRRPDPLAGFRDRLVRQSHHVEGGNAGRDLDLDVDRAGLDALERDGGYTLDHECPWMHGIVAQRMVASKNICGTKRRNVLRKCQNVRVANRRGVVGCCFEGHRPAW